MTFLHSGGAGDVVYALPFVRQQGGGILYLKPWNPWNRACDVVQALRALLEREPYVLEVRGYDPSYAFLSHDPGIAIDCDLDLFRRVAGSGRRALPLAYFDAFGISPEPGWKRPWLSAPPLFPEGIRRFAVVSRTPRYRDPSLSWDAITDRAARDHGAVFYVGLPEEHALFERETGRRIPFFPTPNLLAAARVLAASEAVYSNQGAILTLAQALGRPVFLEAAPGQSSAILGLEQVLNP